jgi:chromosome segregation ATPase
MTTADENQTTATVQPAFAEPSEVMPTGGGPLIASDVVTDTQYAELLQKIKNSLSDFQMDFQVNRPVAQEILQESQAKFSEIMGIVNHRLKQAETDLAKLEAEIVELKSSLSAALSETYQVMQQMSAVQAEKTEIEATLKQTAGESQKREQEAATLKSELVKVNAMLDAAVAEKIKFEKKLNQFQEQWDKYVAGS